MKFRATLIGLAILAAVAPAWGQTWFWNKADPLHQEYRTTKSIVNFGPSPGSIVTTIQPAIVARFHGEVKNVRMWVDDQEVTADSVILDESITWEPPSGLGEGYHIVQVFGVNAIGLPVSGTWSFVIDSRQ